MDLAALLEEQIRRDFAEQFGQFGQPPAERRDEIPDNPMAPVAPAGRPQGNRPAQPPRQANNRQQRPAAPMAVPHAAPARAFATPAGPLDGAIARIEDAIGDENRSRVSQLREMRRMQHEKEIEMIRAQAALERVRQARMADQWSGTALGPGLIDMTGTARRVD